MSTRGAVGFYINGKEKVQYNHSDSYPSGLGVDVLGFIRDNSLEEIRAAAERIKLVSDKKPPTKKQIAECEKFANVEVGAQKKTDWYCLLREAQGDLNAFTKGGLRYMKDSSKFLEDSLFCEWAYIINLDSGKLELYKGFNKDPKGSGRYAAKQIKPWKAFNGEMMKPEYFGVVLLGEADLRTLKRDMGNSFEKQVEFLKRFDPE